MRREFLDNKECGAKIYTDTRNPSLEPYGEYGCVTLPGVLKKLICSGRMSIELVFTKMLLLPTPCYPVLIEITWQRKWSQLWVLIAGSANYMCLNLEAPVTSQGTFLHFFFLGNTWSG